MRRDILALNVIEFLNMLSIQKEVAEYDERELKRRNKLK